MRNGYRELVLKDALSDPLIQAVMAADDVDPHELQMMLSDMGSTLRRRQRPSLWHACHSAQLASRLTLTWRGLSRPPRPRRMTTLPPSQVVRRFFFG